MTESPISPIVVNLFIESFESKVLSTATNSPSLWLRYVDDTFVVMKTSHKNECLNHINAGETSIKLTVVETRPGRSMPFLYTLVMPKQDGTLKTKVYRKPPTVTIISSCIATTPCHQNTLSSAPSSIEQKLCSNQQLLHQAQTHIKEVLQ